MSLARGWSLEPGENRQCRSLVAGNRHLATAADASAPSGEVAAPLLGGSRMSDERSGMAPFFRGTHAKGLEKAGAVLMNPEGAREMGLCEAPPTRRLATPTGPKVRILVLEVHISTVDRTGETSFQR